jgi:hypothetical protein
MKFSTILTFSVLALASNAQSNCSQAAIDCVEKETAAITACTAAMAEVGLEKSVDCMCDTTDRLLQTCVPLCPQVAPTLAPKVDEMKVFCPNIVFDVNNLNSNANAASTDWNANSDGSEASTSGSVAGFKSQFGTLALIVVSSVFLF